MLYTVLFSEWSTAVCVFSDRCSWVSCLFWTVQLSAVLQKNPSAHTNSLVLQHFCVFEPFPTMTVWFWDASFHTEDDWGTHYNYYRRFKHSPMLQKKKPCIKSRAWKLLNRMKRCIFFLFYLNIYFFFI